jgi:Sulfotransferase family
VLASDPEGPEAIFIVGVNRSGTTLMRRVLNSHSRVALAHENHYFGHWLPGLGARDRFRKLGDLHDDATIHRLVDLVYSQRFQSGSRIREASGFWRWLERRVPREDVEARLLASDRTERGIFVALLRTFADRQGADIFGEKTPAHLLWVDTLLEWFPNGRVVHMLRDPRAVFVSEIKRRRERAVTIPYRWIVKAPAALETFVLLEVAWAWARAVGRHRTLARRYPDRYRLVRFEDLVRSPEDTIRAVCAFVGLPFEPAMLEQEVVSGGATAGQAGFDADAADRWQRSISPLESRWLERLLRRRLDEMGYERTRAPERSEA